MPVLPDPWSRVKTPIPLPRLDYPTLKALDEHQFATLLRDHLIPRAGINPGAFRQLWALLGSAAGLADRTADQLEEFLDQAESLDTDHLDDTTARRVDKFTRQVEQAYDRLERRETAPLAWAGPIATRYNDTARATIDALVTAIHHHRTHGDDARLYAVLEELGLDPLQHRKRHRH
ncbi:hypothetical protein [Dietzia cercidiphylli]|uniref:hypothetical protein n=1 Tax=Dietzia cercidiphylli TaxID=498199 RepID=UPI00223BC6FC|nr:hypothetical protein [Dietzia cercidiphylli]MCT1516524.1 hypothetical protein [Dietzia cercidiphylli]